MVKVLEPAQVEILHPAERVLDGLLGHRGDHASHHEKPWLQRIVWLDQGNSSIARPGGRQPVQREPIERPIVPGDEGIVGLRLDIFKKGEEDGIAK